MHIGCGALVTEACCTEFLVLFARREGLHRSDSDCKIVVQTIVTIHLRLSITGKISWK